MVNAQALYETVVADFCRAAGIEGADEIVRTQHLTVDDRLIGLILHDEESPKLSVFIELGRTFSDRDGLAYQRMLELNATADPAAPGYFGLHPDSGQAVYCMRFDLEQVDGQKLAELVETQLGTEQRLAEALAAA